MLRPERRPTSPGEILREHFLKPRALSVADLARAVNHSYKHISQVVNGKTAIEAPLAWKLAAVLGTTPEFWLNLQNAVDLWDTRQLLADWQPIQLRLRQLPNPKFDKMLQRDTQNKTCKSRLAGLILSPTLISPTQNQLAATISPNSRNACHGDEPTVPVHSSTCELAHYPNTARY